MRNVLAILAVATFSLPVLAGETPGVRFDAAGLSIDGKAVEGSVLELRGSGDAALLASSRCVEPLAGAVTVELASGRRLSIEPGVRLERTAEGYRLSSTAGRSLAISGTEGEVSYTSSVDFSVAPEGWTVAGRPVKAEALGVQLQQDGGSLGRMSRNAQRMRALHNRNSKMGVRCYNVCPHCLTASIDSHVVRQRAWASAAGF